MTDEKRLMVDEEAFAEFSKRAREAFSRLNLELSNAALAEKKLPAEAICVALAVAGINIAALAITAGELEEADDWQDELEQAIRIKSAGAERARQKARPS